MSLITPNSSSAVLSGKFQETRLDAREQAGRDESAGEYAGAARKGRETGARPLIDVVLRDDYPTGGVVQPDRPANFGRNLDADGVAGRRRARNRQDDDEARPDGGIGGRDEAGGTLLALIPAVRGLVGPKIVVADDLTGLGFG